ncbi:UDP-2,3-diacylglucosamine diphosphatase [Gammaproteobacteria bacterium]|nr:UDP-2,3-diacylglucosamine diphosphatase [Gammaproteobacteria bacterium]
MKHCFISDLHLSEKTPELTQAFLKFLNESKEACTHFYILGDLFETWIGDDDNSPFNTKIKEALSAFTANGPETFFIHGNRDFLIGDLFAKDTGIKILPDPFSFMIDGQKIVLSHGDFLCTDDVDYISFRSQVRGKDWQIAFLSKSLDERLQIAASLRSDSKAATAEKSNEITDVNNEEVINFVSKHKPDLFIHGHTHRPNIHDVGSSKRIVLGDWGDYGWFLTFDNQEFNLEKFSIS